jgi:hypothetical protein
MVLSEALNPSLSMVRIGPEIKFNPKFELNILRRSRSIAKTKPSHTYLTVFRPQKSRVHARRSCLSHGEATPLYFEFKF